MKLARQIWRILTPQERKEGAFLLCAMVFGAVFETVSIGVVLPFIAVLKEPELLSKTGSLRPLLSTLNINDPRTLFFILGPALIALFTIKTAYLTVVYRWLFRYAMNMHVDLARQLLEGYLSAPYALHVQRNSSELIRITTRSVEDVTNIFMVNLLILIGELLVLGALAGLLTFVEPIGTLGALLVLAVPTYLVYRATQPRLAASGRVAEESFGLMIQWAEQAISGVKEIILTGDRAFFLDEHGRQVHRFADSIRSMAFLAAAPRFVIETLAVVAMVTIAAILIARGEDLQSTLLLLGMFALAAVRLIPSTSRMSSALAQLRFRYASVEVVDRELLDLRRRRSDRSSGAEDARAAPIPFRRALAIEHLSCSYPGMSRPAIDDVSLEIPKGHWVAFIGPTGAGKTTLADLIMGLRVPNSGRVLLDGVDLQDVLTGWQRNIGYVPQTVSLIDDTVRRNVAFGVPKEEIDDARVWRALCAAQVDRLVRSLPGELSAIVGERGGRLSGGERQRLGIARALYRDPEVLVIDEGTANLDPATEAAIVEVLDGLRGKKTIVVIAHRLAFVKNCDCIHMLANGRLRNSGSYAELLAKEPAFLEFCGNATDASAADAALST